MKEKNREERIVFWWLSLYNSVEDEFIQSIEERVQKFISREWRNKQMSLAHLMENAEERGRKEGQKEGEARVKALMEYLVEANRMEDMKKALKDDEYMETLLKELNL